MAVPQFDFTQIRNDAIALVKKYGRHTPAILLRSVDPAPLDASKPWRVGDATILQFPFTGVFSTLGFSRLGGGAQEKEQNVIIPGDFATTPSTTDITKLGGEPLYTDRIRLPEFDMTITSIQDITPDDKAIVWLLRATVWQPTISAPSTPF